LLCTILEPNHFSEIWVERIISLLKKLKVQQYIVAGAMGSPVPHTRPLRITGRSSDPAIAEQLESSVSGRHWAGKPGTDQHLQRPFAPARRRKHHRCQPDGAYAVSPIVRRTGLHGVYTILKILAKLENIDIPLERTRTAGRKQYEHINKEILASASLTELSRQLEEIYDQEEGHPGEEAIELPPSIQKAIDEAFDKD
jgi:hypothetical protein